MLQRSVSVRSSNYSEINLLCNRCQRNCLIEWDLLNKYCGRRFIAPAPQDTSYSFVCYECSQGNPTFEHTHKNWVELVATAIFNFSKANLSKYKPTREEPEVFAHVCDVVKFINEHQEALKVNTNTVGPAKFRQRINITLCASPKLFRREGSGRYLLVLSQAYRKRTRTSNIDVLLTKIIPHGEFSLDTVGEELEADTHPARTVKIEEDNVNSSEDEGIAEILESFSSSDDSPSESNHTPPRCRSVAVIRRPVPVCAKSVQICDIARVDAEEGANLMMGLSNTGASKLDSDTEYEPDAEYEPDVEDDIEDEEFAMSSPDVDNGRKDKRPGMRSSKRSLTRDAEANNPRVGLHDDAPAVHVVCYSCTQKTNILDVTLSPSESKLLPGPRDCNFTFTCADCTSDSKAHLVHCPKNRLEFTSSVLYTLQVKNGLVAIAMKDIYDLAEKHKYLLTSTAKSLKNVIRAALSDFPEVFESFGYGMWGLRLQGGVSHYENVKGLSKKRGFEQTVLPVRFSDKMVTRSESSKPHKKRASWSDKIDEEADDVHSFADFSPVVHERMFSRKYLLEPEASNENDEVCNEEIFFCWENDDVLLGFVFSSRKHTLLTVRQAISAYKIISESVAYAFLYKQAPVSQIQESGISVKLCAVQFQDKPTIFLKRMTHNDTAN